MRTDPPLCYNEAMAKLTWKQTAFIDEYMKDFNGTQAAIRAGYSPDSAQQIASENLSKPLVKEELKRRYEAGRMSPEDIVARLEAMAEGTIPTRIVESPSKTYGKPTQRREYDTKGALQDLGKVYALFIDKQIVENIGLEIVDDNDPDLPGEEGKE